MRLRIAALFACVLACASTSWAIDSVKKSSGPSVSGTLRSMSKTEAVIDKTGGSETVPVTDIDYILFDGEPATLKIVRSSAANGAFGAALATLDKIDATKITKAEVVQEIEYYRAFCKAKMALAGGGDVRAAGGALSQFVTANPDSYHFFPAQELLGDLSVAIGSHDAALQFYGVLDQSGLPDYKMRAGVAIGKALLAQQKFPEALAAFENVLTLTASATTPLAAQQKFAATLGKAAGMAETGQPDEGIKSIEQVIQTLPTEASDLQAQAYVTLGRCYEKKESKKQALLAYLHVDVLYASHPQSHSQALRRLAVLWTELGKPERSIQAAQVLKDRYNVAATP